MSVRWGPECGHSSSVSLHTSSGVSGGAANWGWVDAPVERASLASSGDMPAAMLTADTLVACASLSPMGASDRN
eukprot:3718238-Amphidinium_carterae.1